MRLSTLIDGLFENPVVTVVRVKETFNVTYPTARSDLKKLESLGILQRLPDATRITYYCESIYRVTYQNTNDL